MPRAGWREPGPAARAVGGSATPRRRTGNGHGTPGRRCSGPGFHHDVKADQRVAALSRIKMTRAIVCRMKGGCIPHPLAISPREIRAAAARQARRRRGQHFAAHFRHQSSFVSACADIGRGKDLRGGLPIGGASAYIPSAGLKPAMAINGERNKPIGPGGGTRRLHHGSPTRPFRLRPSSRGKAGRPARSPDFRAAEGTPGDGPCGQTFRSQSDGWAPAVRGGGEIGSTRV